MIYPFKTSCIITCHNYEKFVGDAIQSAITQQIPFHEIVIVDDASRDGSVDVIESTIVGHSNCRLVRRKENGGQLRAFEDGVAEISGDWVFFLDADDYFSDHWVSTAIAVLLESPKTDFLFQSPRW